MSVTVEDIIAARDRIAGGVYKTPCIESIPLSELCGAQVFCKLELQQRTGSFKERGARNALMLLSPEQKQRGAISASAGNHALGMAYATAAAAGAVVYVGLTALEAGRTISAILGIAAAFAPRAVGIVYGVSLPRYRSRPGRTYDVDLVPLDASGEARAP
jgi:threonine dehydratase